MNLTKLKSLYYSEFGRLIRYLTVLSFCFYLLFLGILLGKKLGLFKFTYHNTEAEWVFKANYKDKGNHLLVLRTDEIDTADLSFRAKQAFDSINNKMGVVFIFKEGSEIPEYDSTKSWKQEIDVLLASHPTATYWHYDTLILNPTSTPFYEKE